MSSGSGLRCSRSSKRASPRDDPHREVSQKIRKHKIDYTLVDIRRFASPFLKTTVVRTQLCTHLVFMKLLPLAQIMICCKTLMGQSSKPAAGSTNERITTELSGLARHRLPHAEPANRRFATRVRPTMFAGSLERVVRRHCSSSPLASCFRNSSPLVVSMQRKCIGRKTFSPVGRMIGTPSL